ncbi:hypothetical protein [Hymenobacter mucosus]|uniref:DUF3298 domain-containing protein n=1 Tax=Hymenobacter mucosus TaxID=1411120 RepID=A0A238WEX7_9BACT|nr:hypothetical protein [Hymenobacter mucosus]SNR44229.1 hypothetical protein SAMN06269173_102469 [Hymenobacter mucosus]
MKTSIAQQAGWAKYCWALLVWLISGLSVRAQNSWGAEHIAKLQGMMGVYEGDLNGKYPIRLVLRPGNTDSSVVGTYYYLSKGKPLELRGHIQPSLSTPSIELRELAPADTVPTGWFSISLSYYPEVLGHWYNKSGTTLLPLRMKRINGAAQPFVASAQVKSKTYLKYYTVPVVTVPNAALMAMLDQYFSFESLMSQSLSSFLEEVRQKQKDGDHTGLESIVYTKNYNANGLLSITVRRDVIGANAWHNYESRTIDLNTGFPIILADEIQPQKLQSFLALGERKLHQEVLKYLSVPQNALNPVDKQGLLEQHFRLSSTDEYAVFGNEIQCHHSVNYDALSNMISKLFTDEFMVHFTTTELKPFLKPESLLQRLP